MLLNLRIWWALERIAWLDYRINRVARIHWSAREYARLSTIRSKLTNLYIDLLTRQ